MSIYSPYPDNDNDKLVDKQAGRMVAWCLSIFLGLLIVVCVTAAIV